MNNEIKFDPEELNKQARGWTPRMAAELLGDSMQVDEMHYDAPSMGEMQAITSEKPFF